MDIPGSTVAGRYRIEAEIGSGGQADVYRAHDAATGRAVALKILRAGPEEAASQARFRREFLVCTRLRHPGVVRLYDFGEFDGGYLYCAMELFTCPTLAEVIERDGPMVPEEVLRGARQMAEALGCLHDSGVVHRDLKPANVFVDDERFVLTDFGLAFDGQRTRMTRTGTLLGTPHYMAPEQVRGETADPRTDLFGLGLVIFEMLTGQRVHGDASLQEVLSTILTKDPPPPSSVVPGLDVRWDELVARLCAREPSRRPATARDALAAMERIGRGPAPTLSAAAPTEASAVPSPAASLSPRTRLAVALGAVVALLLAGLAVFGGSGITYSALGLLVEPCPAGLIVRWTSEAAYPSRVRCRLGGGQVVEAASGAVVTSHVVLVEGLPGGAEVVVAVVYPSGDTSMEVSAQAGRSVLRVVSSWCTDDAMEVVLESRPVRASVLRLILVDGRQVTAPVVVTDRDGLIRATVPVVPALVGGAVLEDPSGAGVGDVADLVAAAAEVALRRCAGGTIPRLMEGVGAVSQPGTAVLAARLAKDDPDGRGTAPFEDGEIRRRTAGLRDFLGERLSDPELRAAWGVLAALAPLAVETRLMPPELAQSVLESLLDVEGLIVGCAFEGVEPDAIPLDRPPALPCLGRGVRGLDGASSFPVFIPSAEPPLLGLPFPLSPPGMLTRLDGAAAIGAARDVAAVEVAVAARHFRKLPVLVLVDGRRVARIVGSPLLPHDTETTTWLYQRIPPFALRRSPVTVSLMPEVLLGRRTNNRAIVHGVSLRILRR